MGHRSVCVVIPFWNGSNWIERAIQSVMAQTISPKEFFVVNDGSRPEERKLLADLEARYAFKILDKDNGGQGSARNFGVQNSTADLICFLDQDDFFLPHHIEVLLEHTPQDLSDFGFTYGSYMLADEQGQILVSNDLEAKHAGKHPPPKDYLTLLASDIFILPSSSILSRDAFQRIGGFDPQFRGYEDDDLFSRMILAGLAFEYVPQPVYVWCQHSGSTTYSPIMEKSRFNYYQKIRNNHIHEHGRLNRQTSLALYHRFGMKFYQSALLSEDNPERTNEAIIYFKKYASNALHEDIPIEKKLNLLIKLIAIKNKSTLPVRAIQKAKQANRERVRRRRMKSGRPSL